MVKHIHQSVAKESLEFLSALRRYNYVTPTSYLEVLSTYRNVLTMKRLEVGTLTNRLQVSFHFFPGDFPICQDALSIKMLYLSRCPIYRDIKMPYLSRYQDALSIKMSRFDQDVNVAVEGLSVD